MRCGFARRDTAPIVVWDVGGAGGVVRLKAAG